jgi:hypothetical protein
MVTMDRQNPAALSVLIDREVGLNGIVDQLL